MVIEYIEYWWENDHTFRILLRLESNSSQWSCFVHIFFPYSTQNAKHCLSLHLSHTLDYIYWNFVPAVDGVQPNVLVFCMCVCVRMCLCNQNSFILNEFTTIFEHMNIFTNLNGLNTRIGWMVKPTRCNDAEK